MKSIKITLGFFLLVPYFTLFAQGINWGKFDKHPVKELYNKAVVLQGEDYTLLSLYYLGISFEQWKSYYDRIGLNRYFDKYNYSKANEFELRRITPLIKKDIEKRQSELQKIDYFLLKTQKQLGNYSFENNGFLFQNYYTENSNPTIINWIPQRLLGNDNMPFYDTITFLPVIKMQETEAEAFTRKNPNRDISIQIIVENLRKAYSTNTYYLFAEGLGVSTVIQNGNEVIAVSPWDEKAWRENITYSYNSFKDLINSWKANFKNKIIGSMYTKDLVKGTNTLSLSKTFISRIKSNIKLASIYRWSFIPDFKDITNNIEQLLSDEKYLNDLLNNKIRALVTIYNKDFRGVRKDKSLYLKITSYDQTTKKFAGDLQELGTNKTQHIEGSIGSDELSPFIILNKVDQRSNYFLRMYEEKKYCGADYDWDRGYIELTLPSE